MKKALLLILGGISLTATAQNINENKVSFTYIQLPTNPIDSKFSQFEIVVNKDFERSNQDSLAAYQIKLDNANVQYEAALNNWKEQKKIVDRTYLAQMAAWEKSTNAGTVTTQPTAPVYPPQPVKQDIPQPNLHDDIPADMVNNSISIDGFSKGAGGAKVTLNFKAISGMRIVETKSGSGTTTKYSYRVEYSMPVEIKVETPTQGIILNTIIMNDVRSYPLKDYPSKYEYQAWYLDNQTVLWTDLQKNARSTAMSEINATLNSACGYATRTWNTEVFSVKSHKEYNYDDLTTAYTAAKQGYDLIYQSRDRKNAFAKLNEAIEIWKKALTESNVNDNKARINDKITAMIYCNLAEAYMWMGNFNEAELYVNKVTNSGEMKFKNTARQLQGTIADQRLRWKANFPG